VILRSHANLADSEWVPATHRAGVYAEQRFRSGLRNWRRRALPRMAIATLPFCAVYLAAAVLFGGNMLWFGAGLICGVVMTVGLVVWENPPWDVLKWGVGAEGERRTEDQLRRLEHEGWSIVHDFQRFRGNDDHVVSGPSGVYLLETKALRGTISIEDGVLTTRSFDDPRNVNRWTQLGETLPRRARELSVAARQQVDERVWVQPVVVVWGDFAYEPSEVDGVAYVRGDSLVEWLRSRPTRRVELTVATT